MVDPAKAVYAQQVDLHSVHVANMTSQKVTHPRRLVRDNEIII